MHFYGLFHFRFLKGFNRLLLFFFFFGALNDQVGMIHAAVYQAHLNINVYVVLASFELFELI